MAAANLTTSPISPPPVYQHYDYLFKILVIGDSGVGKSCILLRYTDNTFTEQFISTIGVDFKLKTLQWTDKSIKLQIWDTAGQERFRSITASYYRGAHGIVVCFDVTDKTSFEAVQHWLDDSKRLAASNVPMVLVGNKVDLKKQRVIPYTIAKEFADRTGVTYIECSAKTGAGIDKVFATLVSMMMEKREAARKTEAGSHLMTPRSKCCSV